jgi:membrane protein DedA with SNARE-associated domain
MVLENAVPLMIDFISQHGILAVMAGMVIEEIIVPIPSPAIPMAAGALLIDAQTTPAAMFQVFFLIALPASIASVVSSYFVYSIAYYGGKPAITDYGKWIDIKWENVQHVEKHFDSGNEKYYVGLFRALPIVPLSLVSGSAGLFRMNWKQYGIWSFIGMLPRNFGLAMIGWWAKDGFTAIASRIDTFSTWVALLIVGTVIGYILYQKLQDLSEYLLKEI